MISIYDCVTAKATQLQHLNPELRCLIKSRLDDAERANVLELTHILVIQRGDTEGKIIDEVAFTPLANPIDGDRYGTDGFTPFWAWLHAHDGWYEMIHCVEGSSFAYIVFIERAAGVLPELLALCDEYTGAPNRGQP